MLRPYEALGGPSGTWNKVGRLDLYGDVGAAMRLDEDDMLTLHQQLAWLTKREGFTQGRLAQAGIVDELLRGSLEDSFERLRHRFVSAIYTLPDDQPALLLDVFALSADTEASGELLARRRVHGLKVGRKVDTIRTRERAALKALHSRLVSGRFAQAPLVLDVPEMHEGIIYEETSTLIVIKDRCWQATHEHYRFANMAGELDYITLGRSYRGIVTAHPKGDFKVNTRSVEGAGWNDHFWHLNPGHTATQPMNDRTRYDLRFRIDPPADAGEPFAMTLASRALHQRSLLFTLRVKFIGEQPTSIWKFTGVSPFARPHTSDDYNTAPRGADGTATMTLRDVHGGLFNGFTWTWQGQNRRFEP